METILQENELFDRSLGEGTLEQILEDAAGDDYNRHFGRP